MVRESSLEGEFLVGLSVRVLGGDDGEDSLDGLLIVRREFVIGLDGWFMMRGRRPGMVTALFMDFS
jgi:hypothetical protein